VTEIGCGGPPRRDILAAGSAAVGSAHAPEWRQPPTFDGVAEGRLDSTSMEGAEWLRTQLTSFSCSSCGRAYRSSHIRVVAQRDELFFVDLSCRRCGAESLAIVTVESDDPDMPRLDVGDLMDAAAVLSEAPETDEPAVSVDDLLAMHDFLGRFDGDFQGLFDDPTARSGPSAGA
jgi:hypothetical protein